MGRPVAGVDAALLCLALTLPPSCALAQTRPPVIQDIDVQKLANGVIGIISYTVAPDVTTSSLAINNRATSDTGLSMTQFGGGFTWSRQTPLYLEGNAAYARYDPVFVASDGTHSQALPVKWNSFSATGGIGWDFPLSPAWVIRPIFNFTLGYVTSDLAVARWWLVDESRNDLGFLDGGKIRAYGLGGALMLDYEDMSPEADDDLELRYTNVKLRSHTDNDAGVVGHAQAESVSVWARRRIPTGWGVVWDRPVRYVFELASTRFLGNEGDVGLTLMNSAGIGLELDSSAKDIWVTRARVVARYKFGPHLTGWALGMAVSF